MSTGERRHDPVNHPAHYTSHPSGIECIEVTRHMNFNCGNAVKYVWRNGMKPADPNDGPGIADAVQDLQKAIWYLEDEIYRLLGSDRPTAPDYAPPKTAAELLERANRELGPSPEPQEDETLYSTGYVPMTSDQYRALREQGRA